MAFRLRALCASSGRNFGFSEVARGRQTKRGRHPCLRLVMLEMGQCRLVKSVSGSANSPALAPPRRATNRSLPRNSDGACGQVRVNECSSSNIDLDTGHRNVGEVDATKAPILTAIEDVSIQIAKRDASVRNHQVTSAVIHRDARTAVDRAYSPWSLDPCVDSYLPILFAK